MEVRHAGLGVTARVVEGPDEDGNVVLSRGAWRITCRVGDLRRAATEAAQSGPRPAPAVIVSAETDRAGWEVDVRGMTVDEAVDALDTALDRAVLAGHRELRVIHGVGKGVLGAAVSKHLRGHPQVANQHLGYVGEGGRGVTVAELS
jgi:DNA mismatch repair protein MutS2